MSKTVLIVEEDQSNLDFLSELLQKEGIDNIRASNGIDAISIANEYKETLRLALIEPLTMQESGFDAINKLIKIKPYMPLIAITANKPADKELEKLCEIFDDILYKPINLLDFKNIINKD